MKDYKAIAKKALKPFVIQQCAGTARSTNEQCRHYAMIGSSFCSQHKLPDTPKRHDRCIHASEFPLLVDEVAALLQKCDEEAS